MSSTPTMGPTGLALGNGERAGLAQAPALELTAFQTALRAALAGGGRVAALFGAPAADGGVALVAVVADDAQGQLRVLRTGAVAGSFPSLAAEYPQVQLFEREIAEQYGVTPEGHPWLKPVRYAPPMSGQRSEVRGQGRGETGPSPLPSRSEGSGGPIIGTGAFYRVEGEDIHEVAVGPVHAGIIEPGHFRFQCYGETVFHLEIALGYQHRGVERALLGGPNPRSLHYAETLAGDTSIGHATAYCQIVEALAGAQAPARAQVLRGIALELERLANHTGDLGALAGDVGYLPTSSFCGRIRGDFLNMTALLCGNRFGRGLVRPGGVGFDLDADGAAELRKRLEQARKDVTVAVELLWDTPSVMARLEETGRLTAAQAREIGLVGPAARACGIDRDVRHDLPAGIFQFRHIPVSTWHTGDAFARAYVRWLEIQQSLAFLMESLQVLPGGPVRAALGALAPRSAAVALVEGWRGEVCHMALTDERGRFGRYKIVDPSFHNWFGLALALRGQEISDFPLCNKSFSLSYCGFDL